MIYHTNAPMAKVQTSEIQSPNHGLSENHGIENSLWD